MANITTRSGDFLETRTGDLLTTSNHDGTEPPDTASQLQAINNLLSAIETKVGTIETELAKIIKSGEEFTSTGSGESHDVTFTRKV